MEKRVPKASARLIESKLQNQSKKAKQEIERERVAIENEEQERKEKETHNVNKDAVKYAKILADTTVFEQCGVCGEEVCALERVKIEIAEPWLLSPTCMYGILYKDLYKHSTAVLKQQIASCLDERGTLILCHINNISHIIFVTSLFTTRFRCFAWCGIHLSAVLQAS